MLKELLSKLQKLTKTYGSVDPSKFDDPIAMKTSWSPAKGGGTNFKTHNLVKVDSTRIEFRTSIGAKIFYMIFLLVGLGIIIGFSVVKFSNGNLTLDIDTIFPILFGSIFAGIGGTLMYFGTKPIVFDKNQSFYWKGRKKPREVFNMNEVKNMAKLKDIHALQLISEYVRSDKSSYYSYELNLVLKDATRMNVIDHGNKSVLREQANTLSDFLDKPVWDAI